jgi:hypothetical protein
MSGASWKDDARGFPPSNMVEEALSSRKMEDPLYDRNAAPPSEAVENLGFLIEK